MNHTANLDMAAMSYCHIKENQNTSHLFSKNRKETPLSYAQESSPSRAFPFAAISPLKDSASSIFGKSIFGLNTGLSEHRSRGLRAHYKNGSKKSALNFVKNYVSWPCCHKDQMTNNIIVWWCHQQK